MMYEIKHDWESRSYGEWERPKSFYSALEWLSDNIEFDNALLIPWSTNYETFIWRGAEDEIFVTTCNNHDWSLLAGSYETDYDRLYKQRDLEVFLDLYDNKSKTARQYRVEEQARWERNMKKHGELNENS